MNTQNRYLLIILLVGCLGQIGTDIYSPAIPAIAHHLSSSIHNIQWTMAIYMLGIALSQLLYGPLSEALGRRNPLLVGLGFSLLGTLVCILAPNATILTIGRLIQGFGAGATTALWRAIFRDLFTGDELAKYGSYLSILITFMVPAAPAVGGYLQHYLGWRSIFGFLMAYILLTIALVWFYFKETNTNKDKNKLQLSFIQQSFIALLTSKSFIGYSFCAFITYGAFFSWFAIGPVLLHKVSGLPLVAFGWVTLIGGSITIMLASFLNGRLVEKLGRACMLRCGWALISMAGLLILGLGLFFGHAAWTIIGPILLFYFGTTLIWPNTFASAFENVGHIAGYAGTLYACIQLGGGFVMGTIATHLPYNSPIPFAFVLIISPILAWLLFEKIR